MNDSKIDGVLTGWLLEQLVEDVEMMEHGMMAGQFSRHLWFWSVLLGAAVADMTDDGWQAVYASKLRLASHLMGLTCWEEARQALAEIAWSEGSPGEAGLRKIWERALASETVEVERSATTA